jgi:nucleoside-diphosphate-sugar epimerase
LPNGETFFVGAADALARRPLAELLPIYHSGTEAQARELTGHSPAFSTAKALRDLGWQPQHRWRDELLPTSPFLTVRKDVSA